MRPNRSRSARTVFGHALSSAAAAGAAIPAGRDEAEEEDEEEEDDDAAEEEAEAGENVVQLPLCATPTTAEAPTDPVRAPALSPREAIKVVLVLVLVQDAANPK